MSNKVPQIRFNGYSDDWVQRKFSEVIQKIQTGTNDLGSETNSGTPLLKMGNIQRGYFDLSKLEKLQDDLTEGDPNVVAYGDFLFNTRNTLLLVGKGATWRGVSSLYAFNSNIARFTFNGLNTIFFNYLYNTPKMINEIQRRAVGTTSVAAVYPRDLNSLRFFVPSEVEQDKIGYLFTALDDLIAANQRKLDLLKEQKKGYLQKMFPKNGAKVPELRFAGFADDWVQRNFGELYKKVTEKNDLSFGKDKIISVANMYFKSEESRSDDAYMRTYNIFRVGDIAFEGHSSKQFSYGRFVENTIGDGIVSHIFDVFRPISNYDLQYWKYAIINEQVMGRILMTSTTQSTMMNNLVSKDFLKRQLAVPTYEEQVKIGGFLESLDNLIALHQRKLDLLKEQKKGFLQKMFV